MSEREIRGILQTICDELDRHAGQLLRKGVRKVLLPTAVGAGLALAGCGDRAPAPDAKTADATHSDAGATDGAPDQYKTPDINLKVDQPWPMPYMAPDVEPLHTTFALDERLG